MSNIISRIKRYFYQVKSVSKTKTYTIKFKKIPSDISYNSSDGTTWNESLSSTIQTLLLNHASKRQNILVTKMVIKSATSVSYIKFKTNASGYKHMFLFFTHPDVESELELISQFKI